MASCRVKGIVTYVECIQKAVKIQSSGTVRGEGSRHDGGEYNERSSSVCWKGRTSLWGHRPFNIPLITNPWAFMLTTYTVP